MRNVDLVFRYNFHHINMYSKNEFNANPFHYEHAVNQHYNSLIGVGHIRVQY